jgi:hypothetical protein
MVKASRGRVLSGLGLVCAGTVAGFGVRSVLADGVPTADPLYYAGTLAEAGQLVSGARDVTVTLWADAAATGTPLCSTPAPATPVVSGRFRVALAPACTAALHQKSDAWVEVLVGGTSVGRSKIGAVPYALESDHALTATAAASAASAAAAASAAVATSVAAGSVRIETAACKFGGPPYGLTDCTCNAGEIAIGGGAYAAALSNSLSESRNLAAEQGAAMQNVWRLSCVQPNGVRVQCAFPFAVCLAVK